MWDGVHEVWSLNQAMTLQHHLDMGSPTPISLKPIPDLYRCNGERVDPYVHSQHIKVLKHYVYIWYGCGM